MALWNIGDGSILNGLNELYQAHPEKFNVIGKPDSVMPFSTLFTGLVINQLYFWA
jgi:SSS family solute:Na+ symporter